MPLEVDGVSNKTDQMQKHAPDRIFSDSCHGTVTSTSTRRMGLSFKRSGREEDRGKDGAALGRARSFRFRFYRKAKANRPNKDVFLASRDRATKAPRPVYSPGASLLG